MRRLAPSGLGGEEFGQAAMAREWILGHLAEPDIYGFTWRCSSLGFFLSNASNHESQLTGFWISEDEDDFGTTSVIGATYPLILHRGEAWRDSGLTAPDISARGHEM